MADQIRINTARLAADAAQIQRLVYAIQKEAEAIRQSVRELDTMWEGAGKEAFQQAFQEDIQLVQEAVNSMQELCDYDTNALQQYEQCSRKLAVLVAGIKV